MAVADAITYHAQCSLTVGLEEASRSLTLIANPGAEQLRQAMGIVDQLRQQQATGGRDISLGEGSNLQSVLFAYGSDIQKKKKDMIDKLNDTREILNNYKKHIDQKTYESFDEKLTLTEQKEIFVNIDKYRHSFISVEPESYLDKSKNITTKQSDATKNYFGAPTPKDASIAYEEISSNRANAILLRITIDTKKRETDELVYNFNNDLQKLQKKIEESAKTPVLVKQPGDQTVKINGTASFVVEFTGDANSKILWQSSSDGKTWNEIKGETNSEYKTSPVTQESNGKKFRAIAIDKTDESKTTPSNPATLTVVE